MNKNEKVKLELTLEQCAALYCIAGKATGSILGDLWYNLRKHLNDENRRKYDTVARDKTGGEVLKFHEYEHRINSVFFNDEEEREQRIKYLTDILIEAERSLQRLKQL